MFFIKSFCVFFIAVILGFVICTAEKKTSYYYTNLENQKTEITKNEYVTIKSGKEFNEGKDAVNLSKEEEYVYQNAIIYSVTSFFFMMALISVFELWKRKNSAT